MFDEITQMINANYSDDLYLDIIADKFNITPEYLSTYFKKHAGINITTYINNVRIEQAKELICATTLPIKDIGEKVGFANVNTFIRIFKNITGTTPGKFKKPTNGDSQ